MNIRNSTALLVMCAAGTIFTLLIIASFNQAWTLPNMFQKSEPLAAPMPWNTESKNPTAPPPTNVDIMKEREALNEPPLPASLDDNGQQIHDDSVGISMTVPKSFMVYGGGCKFSKSEGVIGVYAPVPVQILRHEESLIIAHEFEYRIPQVFFEDKEATEAKDERNLSKLCSSWKARITANDISAAAYKPFNAWILRSKRINDEKELVAFVQAEYGDDCVVNARTPTAQEGVAQLTLARRNPEKYEGKCFESLMSTHKLLYSPARKKLIYWSLGQEPTFWSNAEANAFYDLQMIDSIRLVP